MKTTLLTRIYKQKNLQKLFLKLCNRTVCKVNKQKDRRQSLSQTCFFTSIKYCYYFLDRKIVPVFIFWRQQITYRVHVYIKPKCKWTQILVFLNLGSHLSLVRTRNSLHILPLSIFNSEQHVYCPFNLLAACLYKVSDWQLTVKAPFSYRLPLKGKQPNCTQGF